MSCFISAWMNKLEVHHMNILIDCLRSGAPLITVSNHHSCIDEPVLWGKPLGVGRLVNEATRVPTVLPIWHSGMEKVLPENACVPRILKKVLVYFGKPIDCSVFEKVRASNSSRVTFRILHGLAAMKHQLFQETIGVSGGKDSAVVLHLLDRLNERFNYGLLLLMVAIDEGIRGYRDDSLESVYKQQKRYCLPLKVLSYKDLFGWSMDEVVSRVGNRSNCTYCGVFRRQALERGCQVFGAGKCSNHLIFFSSDLRIANK
ncbi:hypothetical protein D918_08808 [Trichuris suis]|nr:hypothetical protein D918_08808 [Trichuris suis]